MGQFEDALKCWTSSLKVVQDDDVKFELLTGRARCYTEYATYLKAIPAAHSECAARFALEPQQIAKQGLTDADRAVLAQPEHVQPHVCRAEALLILEEYAAAEQALLLALSMDAECLHAQELLARARSLQPAPAQMRSVDREVDDLDCILCCKLLHRPVTTPCGHSFCQSCFARAMDHSNKCPMCRRVLHTGRNLPVTVALSNIIKRSFPDEHAKRKQESTGIEDVGADLSDLPVFVMASIMPGELIALNIFEPRYRLMFRRCMEGNRKLAMTCALRDDRSSHFLPDIVTECDITECNVQPDGRLAVQCIGVRRLHTVSNSELDGYRICHFDKAVQDAPLPAGDLPDPVVRLKESSAHVLSAITQQAEAADRRLRAAVLAHLAELGPPPDPQENAEALTWWAARLLCTQAREKLQLLSMTSTVDRACALLAKMPNPARAGQGIIQMAVDGNSCALM